MFSNTQLPTTHPLTTSPPDLQVTGMTKTFGPLVALDDVSLHLRPGSFHALLGENGAGKSTLVKCVMGFYRPTAGDVTINGRPVRIKNPANAHKYALGMVYQHFTSVPTMTVAENLVLSRVDSPVLINWKQERDALQVFMEQSPFQLCLDMPVAQLAAGQKQKLEILKQLYLKSRILILDEPTSVLTPSEANDVLGLLKEHVIAGQLSVLMISHKFREVMAFADEVTVLRRGKLAGHGRLQDLTVADMAEMMMGERRAATPVNKVVNISKSPMLEIISIHANNDNGVEAVKGVSLSVKGGEIVGIAGVSGNGQRELMEVLAGQRQSTSGRVMVNGDRYTTTRSEMAQHRVFVLPEEPLRNACVPHMTVAENMALRTFDQPPQAKGGLLVLKAIREMAIGLIHQFSVMTPSPQTPVVNLSGGNIQRTVLARELSSDSIRLLIAANPCFGLDFNAVDFIHRQIVDARNRGVAVLLVSEDVDELLTLSDRIMVISEGKLVYESGTADADYGVIGQRMAGH